MIYPVKGNKINLPPTVLAKLVTQEAKFPYTFEINNDSKQSTVAAVAEFTSPPDVIQLSFDTFTSLKLTANDTVVCTFKPLPKGESIVLQPHQKSFMKLEGYVVVLQVKLRDYPTLCKGETFEFEFAEDKYKFTVHDSSPSKQIYIAETNLNVSFIESLEDLDEKQNYVPDLEDEDEKQQYLQHNSQKSQEKPNLSNVPNNDSNGNGLFDGDTNRNEFEIETWKQSVQRQKQEYFEKLNKRGCRGYRLG